MLQNIFKRVLGLRNGKFFWVFLPPLEKINGKAT